jgi:hypothetical protein
MVSYHVAYLFLAELLIELKSNKADFLHTFSHPKQASFGSNRNTLLSTNEAVQNA